MRITDLRATVVSVPYTRPLRWSFGVSHRSVRTIIEIDTDEGVTGIGEAAGPVAAAVAAIRGLVVGSDPFSYSAILHRLGASTRSFWAAASPGVRSALEMACIDIVGKSLGRTATEVLGGAVRDSVEACAIIYFRKGSGSEDSDEMTPEGVASRVLDLIEMHGYRSIKLHGGVFHPDEEYRCLRLIQEGSPTCRLRWDPNGAWSVETTVQAARRSRSESLNIEYFEDPTQYLEGMSRVRSHIDIPLATNMCVVDFAHLAPAARMGAVDIVLADIGYWGGFRANQQMMAVCDAFKLGLGIHAHGELGIARAAMLHLALVSPSMAYAIDDHSIDLGGDITTAGPAVHDGVLTVPTRPGLGVELDRDAMERYQRLWEEADGPFEEFGDRDDPSWVPATPIF